jgi:hypothetical protein
MATMNCVKCGGLSEAFGTRKTLVWWNSPPGHDHDDNCMSRHYMCRECGHQHKVSLRRTCPTPGCDWKGRAECFCHDGSKLDKWPDEYKSQGGTMMCCECHREVDCRDIGYVPNGETHKATCAKCFVEAYEECSACEILSRKENLTQREGKLYCKRCIKIFFSGGTKNGKQDCRDDRPC